MTTRNTDFEKTIGYTFNDPKILETALTHSSYTKEFGRSDVEDNERLEYLGDAFFDAIIGEALFRKMPDQQEGTLTKKRALIVCEGSLADVGRRIGVGARLRIGKGEEKTGGREKTSIIAGATEAGIGAVFLDGGYEEARSVVLGLFDDHIKSAAESVETGDYKSRLQELCQIHGPANIEYSLDREEGPSHDKTFYMTVFIDGQAAGTGSGKSKKEAGQNAAKDALSRKEITKE